MRVFETSGKRLKTEFLPPVRELIKANLESRTLTRENIDSCSHSLKNEYGRIFERRFREILSSVFLSGSGGASVNLMESY